MTRLKMIECAVVGVVAGVVVNVNAGQRSLHGAVPIYVGKMPVQRAWCAIVAGPAAVEVGLSGKKTPVFGCCLNVADHQDEAARQRLAGVRISKQVAHGVPAGNLVAVLQYTDDQRLLDAPRQMEQVWAIKFFVQPSGWQSKQAIGQVV